MTPTRIAATLLALIALSACESYVQTTSGADYLARYQDAPASDGSGYGSGGGSGDGPGGAATAADDLDAEIRAIAAVEPTLRFPARIGLARIENRRLTAIPGEEGAMWLEAAEALGPEFGEFLPVSPMVAAMVAPEPDPFVYPYDRRRRDDNDVADVVAEIRRGAARQHLDYVFVYEVTPTFENESNVFAIADATIVGFFLLPGRNVKVEAMASGLMLDVRTGYPYATMTAFADRESLARGSGAYDRMNALEETASQAAVAELVAQAADTMKTLAASAGAEPS